MSRSDDDHDLEPASPAEQAHAEAFGRLVDDLLDGKALPPAMESDQRALIEAATVVAASAAPRALPAERQQRLVDEALEAALLGRPSQADDDGPRPVPLATHAGDASGPSQRRAGPRRRAGERLVRAVPWAVAAIAAAAAVFLFVTRPADLTGADLRRAAASMPEALSPGQRSRASDELIGSIPRDQVAGASGRLDTIFADRMTGYRSLRLRTGREVHR